MSFLPESFGYWIGLALLLFWFVGACNRLVRLRSAALQSYAVLDAALVSQLDFVRARASEETARQTTDATADHATAGAATPGTHVLLDATTAQFAGLLAATRPRPLDPDGMAALDTALHVMLTVWQSLHPEAVIRFDADGMLSRPALPPASEPQSDQEPRDAESAAEAEASLAWPEPSPAAEIARVQFNRAVAQYNAAIRQFPAVLVAWALRMHRAAPLR
jgi:hypothetical protein